MKPTPDAVNPEKLLRWITPLTLGALLGGYWIADGLLHTVNGTRAEQRDYGLLIVLGIPMLAGCLGAHFLIRRIVRQNVVYVWVIELVLVGIMALLFMRS